MRLSPIPSRLRSPRRARVLLALALGLGLAPAANLPFSSSSRALVAPVEAAPVDVRAASRTLRNRRAPSAERVTAAQELGRANEASSRRALERALRDRDPEIRAAAARSLGEVGDSRSLRALQRIRRESVPFVRAEIGHAVARLTGDTTLRARVRVGNIAVADGIADVPGTTQLVREEAARMLGRIRRAEVHDQVPPRPDDHSPQAALRAPDGVVFLRLDVAVRTLSYEVEDGVATVRVELQLALTNDPGLMVRAVDTTTASVRGRVSGPRAEQLRQRMITTALRSAVDGAMRNLDAGIEGVYAAQ